MSYPNRRKDLLRPKTLSGAILISIIIPAHNEETVITAALKELIAGAVSGNFEVIVVCNGCTDKTAEIVTSFGDAIKCIETPVPSKANALNLGDAVAKGFPRFYQDADVVLSQEAIRQIAEVLQSGKYFAAAPVMRMDFRNASWTVRSFYEVWQQLPYVKAGLVGVGVYALSQAGRERFKKFPDIIADDRFIRALFEEDERTVVMTCYSVIRAPSTLAALVKIKTRSRLGGYEFERKFPELLNNEKKNYGLAVWQSLKRFKIKPALFIYLGVNLLCRVRAKWQLNHNMVNVWERDETSRTIPDGRKTPSSRK
jgi:glycosyltransferase involved in cell wall biosynthesis